MADFLPAPQDATYVFEQPRQNVESQSGITYTRYSGVGQWTGNMTFEPRRDPGPLMAELQKADKTGGAFLADLRKDGTAVDGVVPGWGNAGKPFDNSIEVPTSLAIAKGDLISLRSTLAREYVTARLVEEVKVLAQSKQVIFNSPIPTEFLTDANSALLQYCVNRPHVRAIFDRDTMRWRRNADRVSMVSTLSWREDLSAAISVLTQRSTQAAVAPDRFETAEDGRAIQAEDGRFIVLE